MEELAERGELMQQFSEEELNAMDRKSSSEDLIEWYKKQGFTIDDPDKKHVWCYSPQGS